MSPTEVRRQLLSAGFCPLPLNGKKPVIDAWQTRLDVTDHEIELWGRSASGATNTGILTRTTPVLDIDILNPLAAQAVEDMVRDRFEEHGYVLARFGRSPKRCVPFRTNAPFPKILVNFDGADGERLELLCDGQQVVVDGVHPDTHQPYSWARGDAPGKIKHDDLPYIHEEEARELVDDAVKLLVERFGYRVKPAKPPKEGAGDGDAGPANWGFTPDDLIDHDRLAALAMQLIKGGMNGGAAVNFLRAQVAALANVDEGRRLRRLREIPDMVSSAQAKLGQRLKDTTSRFVLTRFADIRPPGSGKDYCVKGVLPGSGLVVVWGPPKCGKSFWTFDLLMHVALGWRYRGRRVRQGLVVYVCLEGQKGFCNRKEAFAVSNLKGGEDPPFFLITASLALVADKQALIDDIKRQIGDDVPAVVCIDTLNRSFTGSESSDEDMTAYVKAADGVRDAFDCLVVIVHHSPHDANRPRGHSSLMGALDVQIAVRKDQDNVIAELELAKDMEVGLQFVSELKKVELGLDDDGDPVTSLVIRAAEGVLKEKLERPKRLPRAAQIALRALYDALDDFGEVPPASNHIPAKVKTVSVEKWRDRAIAMGISTGEDRAQRKAFQSATEALVADRKAAIWQTHAWPC
jgi:hypothetical protein